MFSLILLGMRLFSNQQAWLWKCRTMKYFSNIHPRICVLVLYLEFCPSASYIQVICEPGYCLWVLGRFRVQLHIGNWDKPHISKTALHMCVYICLFACLLACLLPYIVNFKWAHLDLDKIELVHSVGERLLSVQRRTVTTVVEVRAMYEWHS